MLFGKLVFTIGNHYKSFRGTLGREIENAGKIIAIACCLFLFYSFYLFLHCFQLLGLILLYHSSWRGTIKEHS